MKNWIRVIVALNSRLDALTEKIDEEVSLMSTSLYEPTMDLINDIIALNEGFSVSPRYIRKQC